jgi:hypothetical protein
VRKRMIMIYMDYAVGLFMGFGVGLVLGMWLKSKMMVKISKR